MLSSNRHVVNAHPRLFFPRLNEPPNDGPGEQPGSAQEDAAHMEVPSACGEVSGTREDGRSYIEQGRALAEWSEGGEPEALTGGGGSATQTP